VVAVAVALAAPDASGPPAWLMTLDPRVVVVTGGAHRGESVSLGLAALPEELDVIVVHDAARPLVTVPVVRECVDVAVSGVGAVAGCRAVDSMKTVDADGFIVGSPDRDTLWHAHTPQAFPASELRRAYAGADASATDDASVFRAAGGRVRMVDDGGGNLKVTRRADVAVAESFLLKGRGVGS
jgi:2-C-methyl-D-erythritol 4-phosphate cytidylyltransferase